MNALDRTWADVLGIRGAFTAHIVETTARRILRRGAPEDADEIAWRLRVQNARAAGRRAAEVGARHVSQLKAPAGVES